MTAKEKIKFLNTKWNKVVFKKPFKAPYYDGLQTEVQIRERLQFQKVWKGRNQVNGPEVRIMGTPQPQVYPTIQALISAIDWAKTKKANAPKKYKWDVLSPDGISIKREGYFSSEKAAQKGFQDFKKRYTKQGYYSSNNGKIALSDLENNCTYKKIEVK
jgi:hypothetical protein